MMEDSTSKIPNGLTEEEKKSPFSLKDRNHRQYKNSGADALERFFTIKTGIELPKGKEKLWDEVTNLVCSEILKARRLEEQQKASITLEKYGERARQIVQSAAAATKQAQNDLNWCDAQMKPLEQIFLNENYEQLRSDVYVFDMEQLHQQFADDVATELENKFARLDYGITAYLPKVQKLYGDPVNLKFSMPQQPDPNNRNKVHRMRKNQAHTALKVFFYVHTNIVLPKIWKEVEELVKEKIKDAEEGKKLNDISGPPEGAATLKQIVNSTLAACEEAKREVENCKCRFQSVGPQIHKQYGASSEAVNPYLDNEALLAYMPESNDMVLLDLPNPPVSADSALMLAPLELREASSDANSNVAAEPHRDDECWLEDIRKIFTKIKKNAVFELLLEMTKSVPHTPELRDTNQQSELDLRVSKLEQEVDKTCQHLGAMRQNKRKLNRPNKLPVKKKGKAA